MGAGYVTKCTTKCTTKCKSSNNGVTPVEEWTLISHFSTECIQAETKTNKQTDYLIECVYFSCYAGWKKEKVKIKCMFVSCYIQRGQDMYVCLPPSGDSTGALRLYMWFTSQLPLSFYWQYRDLIPYVWIRSMQCPTSPDAPHRKLMHISLSVPYTQQTTGC